MKRIISVAILVFMITISTGCAFVFPSIYMEKAPSSTTVPKPDEVQYYDTIEEAVAHNALENFSTGYITEPIKLFQHNNYAVFFYKSSIGNEDAIYVLKHYTMEDRNTLYSTPVMGTDIIWEAQKKAVKMNGCDDIGEIRLYIELLNIEQFFNTDNTKTFVWVLSQTDRVYNLKIEEQSVTEVIEVELDGETGYFWYFDDLRTNKPLTFSNLNRYTEGEMVISMD